MRSFLVLVLVFLAFPVLPDGIPFTRNLQRAAQAAEKEAKVLVVYVTMKDCPFCARLEEEILNPAFAKHELDDVYFVEFPWDDEPVVDINGAGRKSADVIAEYGVVVTPTLLFLGSEGEELATRLVGYKTEDFYWRYLRESVEAANEWID